MRILVACEYSGRVRKAFRKLGHDAWSCDLLPAEDENALHLQMDVFQAIEMFNPGFFDLMIAHPPCTYLTCAAEWAYKDVQTKKIKPGTLIGAERRQARAEALAFFKMLWQVPVPRLCIENPVGVVTSRLGLPKPQIIQPNKFGEDASKATCLWLRGLPPLTPTKEIPPRMVDGRPRWGNQTDSGQNRLVPGPDRWKERSRTYQGIADAMAAQWGQE